MGEMAEYIINGDDCEMCQMPFEDDGQGFPRRCDYCIDEKGEIGGEE